MSAMKLVMECSHNRTTAELLSMSTIQAEYMYVPNPLPPLNSTAACKETAMHNHMYIANYL